MARTSVTRIQRDRKLRYAAETRNVHTRCQHGRVTCALPARRTVRSASWSGVSTSAFLSWALAGAVSAPSRALAAKKAHGAGAGQPVGALLDILRLVGLHVDRQRAVGGELQVLVLRADGEAVDRIRDEEVMPIVDGKRLASPMPNDPAHWLNRSACQADWTDRFEATIY